MAFDESNGNGMVMPVAPMYGGGYGNGGFGFGGDFAWIVILALLFGGGWGNGFGGGFGGFGNMALGYDFPWLLNGQNGINNNVSDGFRSAQLSDGITSIRDGISGLSTQLCGCCGDISTQLCNGFNGIGMQLANGTIADLERSFAAQTAVTGGLTNISAQLAQCCCDNRAATQDVKYTIATEACATRTANTQNTQAILDKLCQLELDGIKGQLAQAQRENVGLQNQLNMAAMRESQTAQNAFISQGFANEVDALYNRLNTCPVPTTPVYGRTPIFTCGGNTGCGCNGNGFMN